MSKHPSTDRGPTTHDPFVELLGAGERTELSPEFRSNLRARLMDRPVAVAPWWSATAWPAVVGSRSRQMAAAVLVLLIGAALTATLLMRPDPEQKMPTGPARIAEPGGTTHEPSEPLPTGADAPSDDSSVAGSTPVEVSTPGAASGSGAPSPSNTKGENSIPAVAPTTVWSTTVVPADPSDAPILPTAEPTQPPAAEPSDTDTPAPTAEPTDTPPPTEPVLPSAPTPEPTNTGRPTTTPQASDPPPPTPGAGYERQE